MDYCDASNCYEDPGYYYDPYSAYYDPSCGNASVGYSYYDDGSGCSGSDTTVESDDPAADTSNAWDSSTGSGCDSTSSDSSYYDSSSSGSGCDSSSDTSSSSSSGCSDSSSSSSSSGCSDASSSSSGCGGSGGGCEGDTFNEQGAPPSGGTQTLHLDGLLGWGAMSLLFGLVLAIHRRRD